MEERSDNIKQVNDEDRDQISDQNVRCDIFPRTFITRIASTNELLSKKKQI